MTRTAKISISLPREDLETADRERLRTGESRSELFRRAIGALIEMRREKEAVDRYVAGYVAEPETDFEIEETDALGTEVLGREPWD